MANMNLLARTIARETQLCYAFAWWNKEVIFLPGFAFALAGLKSSYNSSAYPLYAIAERSAYIFIWLIFYTYLFEVSNQTGGDPEEDRANKPDRPLPSGQVTVRGAQLRSLFSTILFITSGIFNDRLYLPIAAWIFAVAVMYHTPLGKHWFVKNNVFVTLGAWALFYGPALIAGPATPIIKRQAISIALWSGTIGHVQDFRDIKGDLLIGRSTFPIAFGDVRSRWLYALICLPLAVAFLWEGGVLQLAPGFLLGLHVLIGYRVVKAIGRHDKQYDEITNQWGTVALCSVLAISSISNM